MNKHELAARFNLSPRTINNYTADGIIPPPFGKGPAATYGLIHIEAIQDYLDCKHAFTSPIEVIRFCRDAGITPKQYLLDRLKSTLENAQGIG